VPGWHCRCKNGLRKASPPQHFPFPPPAWFSYVLTLHNASLNDPEAGLGLHQLGGGAQQRLAWKLKVGRNTWFLVDKLCFIHKQLSQKEKKLFWAKIGAKRPNYSQNRIVRWHRLVRSDTVILADRNLDRTLWGNYGGYRNHGPKSNITA